MAFKLKLVVVFFIALVGVKVGMAFSRVGGLSYEKPADYQTQQIVNAVRPEVEGKIGIAFPEYTLLSYKTQVVAGTNYFTKVRTGEDEVLHLRIYKHFVRGPELSAIKYPKAPEDEIEYFELDEFEPIQTWQ